MKSIEEIKEFITGSVFDSVVEKWYPDEEEAEEFNKENSKIGDIVHDSSGFLALITLEFGNFAGENYVQLLIGYLYSDPFKLKIFVPLNRVPSVLVALIDDNVDWDGNIDLDPYSEGFNVKGWV